MPEMMDVSIQEWNNGWTVTIDGYPGTKSQVCKTWKEVIRLISGYYERHIREWNKDWGNEESSAKSQSVSTRTETK